MSQKKMPKIILLLLVTCAISLAENSNSQQLNRNVVQLPNSEYKVVTINKNILTVSNNMKSSDNSETCKLTIDPFEDAIIGRIRTMAFQQSIVVWGIRSVEIIDELKFVRYTLLLVDTLSCSYKPLTLPIDEVPVNHPTLQPELTIVPHKVYGKTLNIFYPTLKTCAPCQYYSKDGSITKAEHQIEPPVLAPSKSFHIQPFNELRNQINNGYLFVYNYAIGTAKLEYLNENFKTIASRYLNHTVDTISIVVSAADRQNVAACWRNEDGRDQIVCKRFDSRLNTKASYHLDGDSVSILFDKYENAYISTSRKSAGLHLQIYNVFGKPIDEFDIASVYFKSAAPPTEVYGFLEDFDNPRDYCLIIADIQKFPRQQADDNDYSMKCIDVRKYANLS